MINLDISKVTTGASSPTGDGAFDVFMQAAMAHLMGEYKAERITGDKYAEVYVAIMNNVLNTATQFAIQQVNIQNQNELSEEQKQLILQKIKTEKAQIEDSVDGVVVAGTVGKQKQVYDAQIKGFHDDALQKATKMMTDIWSVQRSTDSGIQPTEEAKIYDSMIGSSVETLFTSLSIPIEDISQVAYVSVISSSGSIEEVTGSETLSISGNMGARGKEIIGVILTDAANKKQQVTFTPLADGNFSANPSSISELANGLLTVSTLIRNKNGEEITVTDTITKK